MAPSLIETSFTSTHYPVHKKIKSPAIKSHVKDVTALEPETKLEKVLAIEKTVTSKASPAVVDGRSRAKNGPRANPDRLWQDIHYTAEWGAIPGTTGMERLALSDADKSARDWFVMQAKILGCEVRIDAIGNIFAVLPGENMGIAPLGMGSHLDTQPLGGRYDGILGVLAGLEVLRSIKEAGIKTYAPVAAIVWANEEGARFNPGCSGSAVWSGNSSLSAAYKLRDEAGATMKSELSRINYLGPYYADYRLNPLSAHLELHIEQGSRLEKKDRKAGIVTGIQGIRWYKVIVTGVRAHAGSTPMENRADALVATSSIVMLLNEEAMKRSAFATVGMLQLDRPSSNTIPGSVSFTVDIRCQSEEGLNDMEASVKDKMALMTAESPKLTFQMTKVWESPAVKFDSTLMSCIWSAAIDEVGEDKCMEIQSFAGHDSALTASCGVPTAMIFVPSKDGISHAPEEFTSKEECGHGTQIFLDAVLKYDSLLKEHLKNSASVTLTGQLCRVLSPRQGYFTSPTWLRLTFSLPSFEHQNCIHSDQAHHSKSVLENIQNTYRMEADAGYPLGRSKADIKTS
ncbi:hypothetical protein G7Y89_g484 [Cudoniella acicularis]|uniref:Peptidase M20 dimerisation domain-containing protein n=1 Tax=Cudoniella acicularis TaxID=354080 RepID=A0A8H4RY30_9HELO|nr:hypothetical protein G7Y89_g484 [Cudoniella acicularis]